MKLDVPEPPPALVWIETKASAVRHSAKRGRQVTSSLLSCPPATEFHTVPGAPVNSAQ